MITIEPPAEAEDTDDVSYRPAPWRPVSLESEILGVLKSGPDLNETIAVAFQRKEQELRALFARLSVDDAKELVSRFQLVRPDDLIAKRFAGLVSDRRVRLIAYLADARRRAALRGEAR